MTRFLDYCNAHGRLETFDPNAFAPDRDASVELCAFVLTLAAIFNDFKDVTYGLDVLKAESPAVQGRKSRDCGVSGGLNQHLFRLHVGIFHEAFNLIRDNRSLVTGDQFLKGIVRQLPRDARDAWEELVRAATGGTPVGSFGQKLARVRNKVSYHYDPGEIHRGFVQHFLAPENVDSDAYVSRGSCMNESRFYFADAAYQSYANLTVSGGEWADLVAEMSDALRRMNLAFMGLIVAFVQKRAGAFRAVEDEVL